MEKRGYIAEISKLSCKCRLLLFPLGKLLFKLFPFGEYLEQKLAYFKSNLGAV